MLLNAAEALEKEALQNNEEKARMMTQYEKVCLDNRQLNRMLEEANKRKVVSNDTNGYDFRDQQRRGIPGPPPAPPAPEQRIERAALGLNTKTNRIPDHRQRRAVPEAYRPLRHNSLMPAADPRSKPYRFYGSK